MSYYKPYYKDKTGAIKELPIDASTLGGLPPSDYAKTSDISFIDIGVISETIFNGSESAIQGLLKIVDTAVSYNYATHVKGMSDGECDPFIALLDYPCGEGTYIGGTSIIRFYFAPSYEDDHGNLQEGSIELIDADTYTKDETNDILNNYIRTGTQTEKSIYASYKSMTWYANNYESGLTLQEGNTGLFGGGSSIYLRDNDITINGKSFNDLYSKVQEIYGNYVMFSIDDALGYTKEVPHNAESYATVNKVGGMSYTSDNILQLNDIASTTVNGITYTVKNGVITLNGTSNQSSTFTLLTINIPNIPNKSCVYFKPFGMVTTGNAFSILTFSEDWSKNTLFNMNNNPSGALITEYTPKALQIDISPNYTFNNLSIKPEITLVSYNMWDFNDIAETTRNGLKYSCTNGIVKIQGTASAQTGLYLQLKEPITMYGGLYTIDLGNKISSNYGSFLIMYTTASGSPDIGLNKPNVAATASYCQNRVSEPLCIVERTRRINKIAIWIAAGETVDTTLVPKLFKDKRNLLGLTKTSSATTNGLTYTVEGGRVLLNGTTTAAVDILIDSPNIPVGTYQYDVMYTSGTTTGTINTNIFLYGRNASDWSNQIQIGKGITTTSKPINNCNLYIQKGVTFTDYVICPVIYEPYTAPTVFTEGFDNVRNIKVTELKSAGYNIIQSMVKLGNGYINAITGDMTSTSASVMYDYFPIGSHKQVLYVLDTYNSTANSYTNRLGFYDKNKAFIGWVQLDANKQGYDVPIGTAYIRVSIDTQVVRPCICFYTQPDGNLSYVTPMSNSLIIPSDLPDWGLGINKNCYNYIDYSTNKYVQKVASYVIKDSDIKESSSGYTDIHTYIIQSTSISKLIKKHLDSASLYENILIEGFKPVIGDELWMLKKEGCAVSQVGQIRIFRNDIQTLTKAKEVLVGKTIIYELETPIVTSLVYEPDDILEVEYGGTIILENEYGYDVPSEIEYQLKGGN